MSRRTNPPLPQSDDNRNEIWAQNRRKAALIVAGNGIREALKKIERAQRTVQGEIDGAGAAAAMLVENAEVGELSERDKVTLIRAQLEIANGTLSVDTLEQLLRLSPQRIPLFALSNGGVGMRTSLSALREMEEELKGRWRALMRVWW